MSKLVVLLCVLFVANALDDAQAGFIKNRLKGMRNFIAKKLERTEATVAHAKEEAQKLTEEVENLAEKFTKDVSNKATGILDRIDRKVLELIGASNDSSVSDCAKLAEVLHNTTQEKIEHVAQCATDRVGQSNEYVQSILSLSEELVHELRDMMTELDACAKNATSLGGSLAAKRCGRKVIFKAKMTNSKKLAVIFLKVAHFKMFVGALPLSLPFCAVIHGIETIGRNSADIFENVKLCVDENINRPTSTSA